ncbi:hypothetical protein HDK77DRAFT_142897 [Phyllosticta capitalensis]
MARRWVVWFGLVSGLWSSVFSGDGFVNLRRHFPLFCTSSFFAVVAKRDRPRSAVLLQFYLVSPFPSLRVHSSTPGRLIKNLPAESVTRQYSTYICIPATHARRSDKQALRAARSQTVFL